MSLLGVIIFFLTSEASAFKLELKIVNGNAATSATCTCDDTVTSTVNASVPPAGPQHLNLMNACGLWCKDHELVDYASKLQFQMDRTEAKIRDPQVGPRSISFCIGPGAFYDPPFPPLTSNTLRWDLNQIVDAAPDPKTAVTQKWATDYSPLETDLEYALGKVLYVLPKIVPSSRIDKHPIYFSNISPQFHSDLTAKTAPAQKLLSCLKVITRVTPVVNQALTTAQANMTKVLANAQKDRGDYKTGMANWCKSRSYPTPQQILALINQSQCPPVNGLMENIKRLEAEIAAAEKALRDFPTLGSPKFRSTVAALIASLKAEIPLLLNTIASPSCGSTPTPTPAAFALTVTSPSGPIKGDFGDPANVRILGQLASTGDYILCGNAPDGSQKNCVISRIPATNQSIILSANLGANTVMGQWTGACSGSASTCTVKIDGNKNVGLTYTAKSGTTSTGGTATGTTTSTGTGSNTGTAATVLKINKPTGPGNGTANANVYVRQNYDNRICGNGSSQNDCNIPIAASITGSPRQVELTANLGSDVAMGAWTGACSGSASRCVVTMNGDKTVGLTFVKAPTLTITAPSGPGNGVGDFNAYINPTNFGTAFQCGNAPNAAQNICSYPSTSALGATGPITPGTKINLKAVLGSGVVIGGWTGACSGSASTCTVTMDSDKTVGLTFVKAPTLTITPPSGSGNGVGANNVYINPPDYGTIYKCGNATDSSQNSCVYPNVSASGSTPAFTPTSTIKLKVVAGSNIQSFQWTGDCASAGSSATCTLTMTKDKTVGLTFTRPQTVPLTVTKPVGPAPAAGTSTSKNMAIIFTDNNSIFCGTAQDGSASKCSLQVGIDSQLKLTAAMNQNIGFAGWSGDCNGTGASQTCNLTMDRAKTAGLTYYLIPTPTPTPAVTPAPTTAPTAAPVAHCCMKAAGGALGPAVNLNQAECLVSPLFFTWTTAACGAGTASSSGSSDPDDVDANSEKCAGMCELTGLRCKRCVNGIEFVCMKPGWREGPCGQRIGSVNGNAKCCLPSKFQQYMTGGCSPSCPVGQDCLKRTFGWKCRDTGCSASCGPDQVCKKKGWYKKLTGDLSWVYFFQDTCITQTQFNEIVSSNNSSTYQTTTPAGYNADGTKATTSPTCPADSQGRVMHSHDAACGSCHVKGSSTVCAGKTSYCER